MGYKTQNLVEIERKNFNIHCYEEISNVKDLLNFSAQNAEFSIRFDSAEETDNLPFFSFTNGISKEKATEIIKLAARKKCTLLCSNGKKHDKNQICNFVYKVHSDNSFLLELSFDKMPLRNMYANGTVAIIGNLLDEYYYFSIFGNSKQKKMLSKTLVEKLLSIILQNNVKNKYCECTLYPYPVGTLSKEFVLWQIK